MRSYWVVVLGLAAMMAMPILVDDIAARLWAIGIAGGCTAISGLALRHSPHRGTRLIALAGASLGALGALGAWLVYTVARGFGPVH